VEGIEVYAKASRLRKLQIICPVNNRLWWGGGGLLLRVTVNLLIFVQEINLFSTVFFAERIKKT